MLQHLRREPFQPTADPAFFFPGGQAGDVLDRIVAALRARRGVCVLTGEPGTGKTTVLRRALDELATSSPLVPICGDAPLDLGDLISLLGAIEPPSQENRAEQLEEVERRLRELAEWGGPVVLAIDDAQALDEKMLGTLISLLEGGSSAGALASLVLVGEPGLASRLEARAARGIEIVFRGSLDPLRFAEIEAYIAHRSREAGGEAAELFSSSAVERIARLSGGVPRVVNLLCREALAAVERQGARRVVTTTVDAVAEKLGFAAFAPGSRPGTGQMTSRPSVAPRHVAWAAVSVAVVVALLILPWLPHTARPVPPVPKALPPVEPRAMAGSAAEPPIHDPHAAVPRPPDRRPDTRDTALRAARPGSATGAGRPARAGREPTSPTSPVPIDHGHGQELLLRVENGDLAGVLALLAAGESPDATDRTGLTPLMLAAIRGDAAVGDALLQRGASVNRRNHAGQTALMMTAINNHRTVAVMLLDRGADVNARTTDGWTALTYAAWEGHPDIVRLLLARGADASLKDRAGWTAQRYAAWRVNPPTSVEREGVVTGIDNVEPSRSGPGHSEILRLLTESRRR